MQSRDVVKGYDKSRWIKATFDRETKRIAEPPREYAKLVQMFVRKFGVLRSIASMIKADKEASQNDQQYRSISGKLKL